MRPLSFLPAISQPIAAGFALSFVDGVQYVGGGAGRRAPVPGSTALGPYAYSVNDSGSPVQDDFALIAAMARGDERAAAQLYDRYSPVLFALALRVVGESADAEEVVLDAFTQAWNSASRYEVGRGTVLGWLTTIARTRALDLVRSRGRRSKAVETATRSMGDEPIAVAAATSTASERVEEAELATAVTSALSVLSGQQRMAIELAFYDGLTHTEIAERLGEPLGTVKTRIRLGMQKLRDVLRGVAQEMAI